MVCILIIDDDADLRSTLRDLLEQASYEVVEAADGREGVASYEAAPTDLIITDLLMPVQEGLETITALRRLNPQVKIIAITGGGQTGRHDFLRAAAVMGAQRTLHKPFNRQTLLAAVHDLTQGEDEPTRPAS